MTHLLTPYTDHTEANIWLNAAKAHGWEIEVIVPQKALAILRKGKLRYQLCRGAISANPVSATEISRDKFFSNVVLRSDIPYVTEPRQYLVDDVTDQEIEELLAKHKMLVVKPVDTNNGIGVSTSLQTLLQVRTAIQRVKDLRSKWVLIENHIHATNEFRIVLWKGKVVDILHRIPAFVTGDGQKNIEELISEKNSERSKTYYDVFDPIVIDESLQDFLNQQHTSITDVPAAGEKVTVRQMCNLSQGGETERVPVEKLHPEYARVFEQVYQKTWLNYCGVDLIAPDVSSQPNPQTCVINELNGSPAASVGFFSDLRQNTPFYGVGQILHQMEHDPVQFME